MLPCALAVNAMVLIDTRGQFKMLLTPACPKSGLFVPFLVALQLNGESLSYIKHLYKCYVCIQSCCPAHPIPGSLYEGALVGCVEEQEETQCCLNLFFREMCTWHNFPLFVLQDERSMLIISAVGGILNLKMGCFALGKVFFFI